MQRVPPSVEESLQVLRASHNVLADIAKQLDGDAVASGSYCDDWNRGQVFSHLGSGAEIGLGTLRAALGQGEAPENEQIWDRWNAMSPADMAAGFVEWDDRHIATMEQLDAEQRDSVRLPFFIGPLTLAQALVFRLNEHTLHSWDIRVSLDPTATLLPEAVPLMLDLPTTLVRFAARPAEAALPGPVRLAINTTEPEHHYLLSIDGDQATLSTADGTPADATGTVDLPAESFLRLISGRLDPAHTPSTVHSTGFPTLDDLRRLFPGY
jgi:uncharacterized protein (TIGR03083 family)